MKITYDEQTDAAYIYLTSDVVTNNVAHTYMCNPLEVNGQINLDFDLSGKLIGIEILDAKRKLSSLVLQEASLL